MQRETSALQEIAVPGRIFRWRPGVNEILLALRLRMPT
jgi:hypothetical protein